MSVLPQITQLWISTEMIPYMCACLSRSGKVSQRAHLLTTCSKLHEGKTKDTVLQKQMSLALDWMTSEKGLKALTLYTGDLTVVDNQLKAYIVTCFKRWLYNKQEVVIVELFQLDNDSDIVYDDTTVSTKVEEEHMFTAMHTYIQTGATESETFIYTVMLGLTKLEYSDKKRTNITNYPGGDVSMKTYYNRREAFIEKMKKLVEV